MTIDEFNLVQPGDTFRLSLGGRSWWYVAVSRGRFYLCCRMIYCDSDYPYHRLMMLEFEFDSLRRYEFTKI